MRLDRSAPLTFAISASASLAACAEAATRGLRPALDVVETNHDAIRLYEQRGWRRVRSELWAAAHDGNTLLHYYVAPPGDTG